MRSSFSRRRPSAWPLFGADRVAAALTARHCHDAAGDVVQLQPDAARRDHAGVVIWVGVSAQDVDLVDRRWSPQLRLRRTHRSDNANGDDCERRQKYAESFHDDASISHRRGMHRSCRPIARGLEPLDPDEHRQTAPPEGLMALRRTRFARRSHAFEWRAVRMCERAVIWRARSIAAGPWLTLTSGGVGHSPDGGGAATRCRARTFHAPENGPRARPP